VFRYATVTESTLTCKQAAASGHNVHILRGDGRDKPGGTRGEAVSQPKNGDQFTSNDRDGGPLVGGACLSVGTPHGGSANRPGGYFQRRASSTHIRYARVEIRYALPLQQSFQRTMLAQLLSNRLGFTLLSGAIRYRWVRRKSVSHPIYLRVSVAMLIWNSPSTEVSRCRK
jgi:hypothetical protein